MRVLALKMYPVLPLLVRINHAVVVTGVDTGANVVHLNDSGTPDGRDEQIPLATFTRAWATSNDPLIVTR
jgi:hypothetical protein